MAAAACCSTTPPPKKTARAIAAAHRRLGTTAILPTLITAPPAAMHAAAAVTAEPARGILGLHFEGPFLSRERPGVHPAHLIRAPDKADLALLERAASNQPVLLTVAPETLTDAQIARLAAAGIVLAAGHTAASAERTQAALAAGITGFTHLFNAMPPLAARAPGPAGAALGHASAWCGVIADGIHVHPAMLRLLLAAKPGRTLLVSDAMPPTGTTLAGFTLAGQTIYRAEGALRTDDGTLAGADICLLDAVRYCVRTLGLPPAQAIGLATAAPAAFMGVADRLGHIAPGLQADLLLLTPGLDLLGTWLAGTWQGQPGANPGIRRMTDATERFAGYVATLGRGPGRSRALTREEAADAIALLLAGAADPVQIGAFLMLLRYRGEDPDEITGLVQGAAPATRVPDTAIDLDWPSYGAGRTRGAPWFLLSALALSRAGFRILMHGTNDFTGGMPVAEALSRLGRAPAASVPDAARLLAAERFAYLPIATLNPALAHLLGLRRLLGLRSPLNTVARLLDPAGAPAGVDGVFHPAYIETHLAVAERCARPRLLVLKGGGGEAERNPRRATVGYLWTAAGGRTEIPLPAIPCGPPAAEEPDLADLWAGRIRHAETEARIVATIELALLAMGIEADAAAIWAKR